MQVLQFLETQPDIARRVRGQGIVVEACLSSNAHTGAITALSDHPFRTLTGFGIALVPCSDN